MKLAEIIKQLSVPVDPNLLDKLSDKGNAPYIPWHVAVQVMDERAALGGWQWEVEVKPPVFSPDRIYIVVCIKIHAEDGVFCREATGTETLKFTKRDGTVIEQPMGDPSSNAESMAKRRAMAQFGLGLYLYDKEGRDAFTRPQSTNSRPPAQFRTTPAPPPVAPAFVSGNTGDNRKITEAQSGRLYSIASAKGWKREDVKALLEGMGFDSSLDIPRSQYDAIVARVQQTSPQRVVHSGHDF